MKCLVVYCIKLYLEVTKGQISDDSISDIVHMCKIGAFITKSTINIS